MLSCVGKLLCYGKALALKVAVLDFCERSAAVVQRSNASVAILEFVFDCINISIRVEYEVSGRDFVTRPSESHEGIISRVVGSINLTFLLHDR